MSKSRVVEIGSDVLVGVLSGAVGTAAMDGLLYTRYRGGGGTDSLWTWEFAKGVKTWNDVSAPGQVGQKLEQLLIKQPLPDRWARTTTNLVHWATGAGWGLQYGLAAARPGRSRWLLGLSLGPAAWLSSYVLLPPLKVYKPIWDYDRKTLADDLTAHVLYGAVTSAAFAVFRRSLGSPPSFVEPSSRSSSRRARRRGVRPRHVW